MKKKYLIFLLIILILLLIITSGLYFTFKITSNEKSTSLSYPYIGTPQNNYIVVSDGKNFGYFNLKTSKLLNGLNYPITDTIKQNEMIDLSPFTFIDGLAPITNDRGFIGLINTKGKIIIEPNYEDIKVLQKDLILVYKNGQYYFINSKEISLFDTPFETIEILNGTNKIFIISQENKYGIMNSQGKIILECKYNQILKTKAENNNYAFQAINDTTSENYYYQNDTFFEKVLEANNMNIISIDSEYIYYTNAEGIFHLYNIQKQTMKQLKENYLALKPFNNGLAFAINENNKVGFIDENEQIIIPFEYDINFTQSFDNNNYAIVEKNNLVGIITKSKEEILPINYKEIEILSKDNFLVYDENNKINIINSKQKNLTENKYLTIETIKNSPYLLAKNKNNLYGIINNQGEEIISTKYQNIKVYQDYVLLQAKENEYTIQQIN